MAQGWNGSAAERKAATQRLEALFQRLVAQRAIRHAVAVVESGDGSFRWARAAGEAHPGGDPMHIDTPIWIASVTKLYIAAATLGLVERGLVALDAPLAAYLPSELVHGIHRLDGVDHTAKITVQHLLAHSSGLPDLFEDRPRGGASLFELILEEDRSWTMEEAIALVRDRLTPHFAPQPLEARRHTIKYSDTNYQLLIAIIEAVTGQSMQGAMDELIFKPLGLQHTYHPDLRASAGPEPATLWAGDRPLNVPLAMASFGDLISTTGDQVRFMRALIGGQLFEHPATLGLMMGRWNRFGFSVKLTAVSPGWPIEYGLGMMRLAMPRFLTPLRAQPPFVGHSGATGSWLFWCEPLDLYLCGSVDQLTAAAAPFRFAPQALQALT